MYLYTMTYLLLVNMKYVTCMLRILHLLCPIIFCKITSAFAYFCNMYLTCAPQCYSLLTPCNEIQCPLLSNWEKSNICKMQYAIYKIRTMQYFAICNMQYFAKCNMQHICKMQYAIYNIRTMQHFAIRNMQYYAICMFHSSPLLVVWK